MESKEFYEIRRRLINDLNCILVDAGYDTYNEVDLTEKHLDFPFEWIDYNTGLECGRVVKVNIHLSIKTPVYILEVIDDSTKKHISIISNKLSVDELYKVQKRVKNLMDFPNNY